MSMSSPLASAFFATAVSLQWKVSSSIRSSLPNPLVQLQKMLAAPVGSCNVPHPVLPPLVLLTVKRTASSSSTWITRSVSGSSDASKRILALERRRPSEKAADRPSSLGSNEILLSPAGSQCLCPGGRLFGGGVC